MLIESKQRNSLFFSIMFIRDKEGDLYVPKLFNPKIWKKFFYE